MLHHARSERFGLERRYHRSLLPLMAPLAAWQRFAPFVMPDLQSWAIVHALDAAVSRVLDPCDVLICMSGVFVRAIVEARRRYGARIWIERGSRHILSQLEILRSVPGAGVPSRDTVVRELEGYRLADHIVVPARHVAESFERDPIAYAKLFVNPYGTRLEMFPYRDRPPYAGKLRLVFAGAWSLRKGCDLLEAVVRSRGDVHLLHVGPVLDLPFPQHDQRFRHIATVSQEELCTHYQHCDAFIHPSREEGLSVVQAQALASGLPLICTDRTGGADLGHTPALRHRITVVRSGDLEALGLGIDQFHLSLRQGQTFDQLTACDLDTLSWKSYAKRYSDALRLDLDQRLIRDKDEY